MATTQILSDTAPGGLTEATGDASGSGAFVLALAGAVAATSALIKAVSDLLPSETRSTVVEVVNLTSRQLTRVADNFAHGGFGQTLPGQRIAPFTSNIFSVESDGVATGVEGSCTYVADGVGDFLIGFDNPFVGSNSVNANASPGFNAQIAVLGEKSDGNHNHARFVVAEKTAPVPGGQPEWSACSKCSGMYFSAFGQKSVCPEGGQHEPSGSFNYVMIFNSRPSTHVQTGWRSCQKCQGMHFAGFSQKGICPANSQHDPTSSFEYVQLFDTDPVDHIQLSWASCKKCQGLFFRPKGGKCPGGGQHDATDSFNYGLRFS